MLILQRKCQEAIIIAEELRLAVKEIAAKSCVLTLSGPPEVLPSPCDIRVDLNEAFTLGDDLVKVKLTDVKFSPTLRSAVKLGFTADRSVRIDREEIHTRRDSDKRADILATAPGGGAQEHA